MSTESIVITLLIGAVAGWLAGQIRQGFGFGLVGNIVIGILGSFVGSWLFGGTWVLEWAAAYWAPSSHFYYRGGSYPVFVEFGQKGLIGMH